MTDDSELPRQRRERFLRFADQAQAKAARIADPTFRKAWTDIARSWAALAGEIPLDAADE